MNRINNISNHIFRKIVLLLIVVIFMSSVPVASANAMAGRSTPLYATKEDVDKAKAAKDQKEAELNEAEGRLAATQSSLNSLQNTKNSYQGQMDSLNAELQLVADNLAVMEIQMELKEMEIEETIANLESATQLCEEQYASMKERIRFLYEQGDTTYLEMLLSSNSFGEFLNYADYIEQLTEYDRRMLDEYIVTLQVISDNKIALEDEYATMQELEQSTIAEQNQVTGLIQDTAENIANTADSINNVSNQAALYEAECDARQQQYMAANQEYLQIKAQYEEELRMSQLAASSSWRDISQVTFEEGDRYLLANLIYCEAGGEPYEGKVAVGSVVINRVLSSVYPNTVTGVIYQNKQFSPVRDGHLASALANDKATESCYQAADEAMGGMTNVGNCVYFRTPIEGLTGLQIGHHIFY